jgi:hypothetical protein
VKPTKIEREDKAYDSHKKPKPAPSKRFEVLYDYNGRPTGQKLVEVEERSKSQVTAPVMRKSESKKEALIVQQPSPKLIVPVVEEPK